MRITIEIEDGKVAATIDPPAGAATHPRTGAVETPLEVSTAAGALAILDAGPPPDELAVSVAATSSGRWIAPGTLVSPAAAGAIDAGPAPAELVALGAPTAQSPLYEKDVLRAESGDIDAGPAPGNPPVSGASSRRSRKKPG